MQVQRWHTEPVEELSPTIGRQLVHTEKMTIARITLGAGGHVPRHEHVHEQVANVPIEIAAAMMIARTNSSGDSSASSIGAVLQRSGPVAHTMRGEPLQ